MSLPDPASPGPILSQVSYNLGARLLHHLALASPALAEVSFDLDQTLCARERRDATAGRHVFVAGLARAGTTILMRRLFRSGAFRSLTYRDMPFVLAPNLWGRLERMGARDMEAVERAHGDGLLVDFDSPEALEELFWRVLCGDDHLKTDRLVPMTAAPAILEKFRRYVAAVLQAHPGKRYLSNNNNILRLPVLIEAFPQAIVVVPFRAPLAQTASLWQQHRRFKDPEHDSGFTRRYMQWLAHHEFGPGHRPFVTAGTKPEGDPDSDPGYWLQLWIEAYDFVLRQAPTQSLFVSYDRLCQDAGRVWPRLCAALDLPGSGAVETLHPPRPETDLEVCSKLLRQAEALHEKLLARAV